MITKIKIFFLAFVLCWSTLAFADTDLVLIHTNDIHAHLLPTDKDGQDCIKGDDCLGGLARLYSFVSAERIQNPNVIVLDAGDRFAGTPFYTFHKENDLIPLFNLLKMDAITLGNHEFDDEASILENFLKNISSPCILTNGQIYKNPFLKDKIAKSLILEKGNARVGILGALTPDVVTESMHGNEVEFTPTISALQTEIDFLKRQGVSIIVLLSHLGLDEDKKIAEFLPEIDIIVGGHTHSLLSNTDPNAEGPYPIVIEHQGQGSTLIVSTGAFGRYIGKLSLRLNDKGDIISFKGNTVPLSDKIPTDKKVAQLIEQDSQDIRSILKQKLQILPQDLLMTEGKNYCAENCPIGQALTDMILSQIQGADVVLMNSGSIRSGWKSGDLLMGSVLQALPFGGEVVQTDMTGQALKNYLEQGLQKYQSGRRVNTLLQSAGAHYQFDPVTRTIVDLKIKDKDVIPDQVYHVALPLFIAKGGDGFIPILHYQILPKTIIDYVQASLIEKPYVLDKRVSVQKVEREKQ